MKTVWILSRVANAKNEVVCAAEDIGLLFKHISKLTGPEDFRYLTWSADISSGNLVLSAPYYCYGNNTNADMFVIQSTVFEGKFYDSF